jgi:uncharacterized protein (TIGR02466 family)
MKINDQRRNGRKINSVGGIKWDFSPQFLVSPLHTSLPAKMLKDLIKLTDHYVEDKNSTDYSDNLAGRIKRGRQVELSLDEVSEKFCDLLLDLSISYIDSQSDLGQDELEPYEVSFVDMWVVSQREKDFNPIHQHGGELSGIVYLKVPPQINPRKFPEGYLEFVHGRSKPETLDFNGSRAVLPVVGDVYIFPAWLQHIVYPFYGEGERRSLSFNILMNYGLDD